MKQLLTFLSAALVLLCSCDKTSGTNTPEPDPITPNPEPTPEVVEPLTSVPFKKGFNLSDWFNVEQDYWFDTDTYNEKDFDQLQSLGIDVVRLPINFPVFMGQAPDYKFSDKFLTTLDKAVGMAEARGMYVILDQHSYYGSRTFPEGYGEDLIKAGFRQLAARYKDRSDKIVYELFNEPGGTYLEKNWLDMQQRLISEIRAIDKKHILIVTPVGCHYSELQDMPDYDDPRLIYTFHFYTPFLFTHQGANWDGSPLEKMSGVPFPYDASKMPAMPSSFNGNQEYLDYYNNYPAQGTEKYLGELLMNIYSWASSKGKLLFCGEFGTLTSCDNEYRAKWYKTVCDYFAAYNIAWTAWEYRDTKTPNFGIFQRANIFESNLNVDLIRAMGLNVPAGYETGCPEVLFFDDDIPFWWSQGGKWDGYVPKVDFACKDNPYNNSINCIRVNFDNKYGGLIMTVWPVADFTQQYQAGARLEFAVRTTDVIDKLVVRFTQYKTGAKWQWRNMTEISTTNGQTTPYQFEADGKWHLISIPLKSLWVHGTQGDWKDAPEDGEEGFAWDCINHLEFNPEGNEALLGKTLDVDYVRIVK